MLIVFMVAAPSNPITLFLVGPIVQVQAVPRLVQLLAAEQQGLACAAAAALMMATVVREGKYAMVDTQADGGFQKLASTLDPRKGQLCTDAMQVRMQSQALLCCRYFDCWQGQQCLGMNPTTLDKRSSLVR